MNENLSNLSINQIYQSTNIDTETRHKEFATQLESMTPIQPLLDVLNSFVTIGVVNGEAYGQCLWSRI